MNTEKAKKNIKVDSREYNIKSKIIFVLVMIICGLCGGFFGYYGARATDIFKTQLDNIQTTLDKIYPQIQVYIIPWVMLAFILTCFTISVIWLQKSRKQIATWDGEDDEHIQKANHLLNKISYVANVLIIVNQILFALATYNLTNALEKTDSSIMIPITIGIFFAGLLINLFLQNNTIKLIKQYAPEKKGSIYDMNFQKIWYKSCDEAERQLIGEASYQTFQFMSKVFSIILALTITLSMLFPIGILCGLLVGILWLLMSCYYTHTCIRFEGNK